MFVFVYIFWKKNVFWRIKLWFSDAKITLKHVYCVYVAYFVVFKWALSTRLSGEAGKALWFFFPLLFSLGIRRKEIGKPDQNFWEISSISLTVLLKITLRVLRKLWNVFKLWRETQKTWHHNRIYILSSGAHYPERTTFIPSLWNGVFTSRVIFKLAFPAN